MSVSLNLIAPIKKHIVDKTVQAIEESARSFFPETKTNVVLTICDDAYIEMLNAKYRKKYVSTDVLSFPMIFSEKPGHVNALSTDFDPQTGELQLGDIIISIEKAAFQAKEYGHSLERELCYLAVHSVLHLVGYDHIEESDKKEMREKEEEILSALGITRQN